MSTNASCPAPFLDASRFPVDQGYINGRLCATVPLPGAAPGAVCCLPCPAQDYTLHASSLLALHVNDIVNVIGVGVGAFVLLSFIFLPEKVTHRCSLGIGISVAAFLINFCFVFSLHDLKSVQCANDITPASQSSNPICGFQGALHVFAGHSIALLVVCRTIYLHCQICWNLHVVRLPLIFLNIIAWLIPAILLAVVLGAAQITYTISNHCSVRADWVVNLLVIPIIIEIGCAFVVQLATFIYCVNVYLRSLVEPPPPSNDSTGNRTATSAFSTGTGRYPYRKAMSRVNKVLKLQWRAWAQCFSLIFIGTLFSVAYYILATKYVALQDGLLPGKIPDAKVIGWVVCLIQNHGDATACDDLATAFIPNQTLLVVAEFSISTCWVWVSFIFLRLSFFPEWGRLIRRLFNRARYGRHHRRSGSSGLSDFFIHFHTPKKDFVNINTTPLETPYSSQFTNLSIDLHPPLHVKRESQAASIHSEPLRPSSSRPSTARPASQRSNTLKKKDRGKKISVEDLLAMRRMDQVNQEGNPEYPGIQTTKSTRIAGDERKLPTYQFGQEGRDWDKN